MWAADKPAAKMKLVQAVVCDGKNDPSGMIASESNKAISGLIVMKTENAIIVIFSFDRKANKMVGQWYPPFGGMMLRLRVRLADEDGNVLKEFITQEYFCEDAVFDLTPDGLMQGGEPVKAIRLKDKANVLKYSVNRRDIRDTEVVEVGFAVGH
jgi:hypothetical protein